MTFTPSPYDHKSQTGRVNHKKFTPQMAAE